MSEDEIWWRERDEGMGVAQALKMRRLHRERSAHQEIEVWEHAGLGRVLVLDGLIQASQADEFLYHEMALHVPLLGRHRERASVLIVGGAMAVPCARPWSILLLRAWSWSKSMHA